MTELSHPYMTQVYLHQEGQQLRLRAKRHDAFYDNQSPRGPRTNPVRRPWPLLAKFAAAAYRVRIGWAAGP
jgi:hypothetical protein